MVYLRVFLFLEAEIKSKLHKIDSKSQKYFKHFSFNLSFQIEDLTLQKNVAPLRLVWSIFDHLATDL